MILNFPTRCQLFPSRPNLPVCLRQLLIQYRFFLREPLPEDGTPVQYFLGSLVPGQFLFHTGQAHLEVLLGRLQRRLVCQGGVQLPAVAFSAH